MNIDNGNDVVLNATQATTAASIQGNSSPRQITKNSRPENRQYLVAEEYRAVADALGIPSQGDNKNVVQSILSAINAPNVIPTTRVNQNTWG